VSRALGRVDFEPVVGAAELRAAVFVLAWSVAALLARSVGIWLAIGSTAALLGLAGLRWGGVELWGRGRHARMIPVGVLVGLVMAAGTLLLYEPVTRAVPALSADVGRLYAAFRSVGTVGVLVLLPVVLTCEEIVWRGVVYGAAARWVSPVAAAAISVVLYTMAHTPYGSPVIVLAALGAGSCWAFLRAYSDSLPAVIAAHAVWDYTVMVIYQLNSGG
jgi:membrane protease YdiL (CAAX protease family)